MPENPKRITGPIACTLLGRLELEAASEGLPGLVRRMRKGSGFGYPATKHHRRVGWLVLQTRKLRVASHKHPDGRNPVENMTVGILAEVRQRGGQAGSSSSGNHCSMSAIQPLAAPTGGEQTPQEPSPQPHTTRSCGCSSSSQGSMLVVPVLPGGTNQGLGKVEPRWTILAPLLFRARQPGRTELPQAVLRQWPLRTCSVTASLLHVDGRDGEKHSKSSKSMLSHARAR